tara:strand:- start:10336 stop:10770 length:435 start_codon:yes stop_codon:yes gene_type:complete
VNLIENSEPVKKENPKMINPNAVYQTTALGYSQAIVHGDLLFSSGMVGWDIHHELIDNKGFTDQVNQSFFNLNQILKSENHDMESIIHLRFYVVDLNETKRSIIGLFLKKYFPNKHKPATTLLGVESLARKELLVEIEMIAKIT